MAVFFAVAGVRARAVQTEDSPNIKTHAGVQRDDEAVAPMGSAKKGGDPGAEAAPAHTPWPCRLIVSDDLQPFVQRAWDLSAKFRDQCERLAAARAVITLHSTSEGLWEAEATIGRALGSGVLVALVRVRRGRHIVKLIAHELEHVLERVDGIHHLRESRVGSAVRSLHGGAFETQRALEAGQRVAREVEQAARARR
jgi:hypothetical protein